MAQLYPDPEDLKHAQDSIENRLKSFDKNIWVPSLEEMQSKAGTATAANDSIAPAKKSTRKISGTRVSSKRPVQKGKKLVCKIRFHGYPECPQPQEVELSREFSLSVNS